MAVETTKRDWQPVFPGWALEPAGWRDRNRRPGWISRYTTVGAMPAGYRFPSHDPRLAYGLASVLIARPLHQPELGSDTKFWVTIARRLLQRGTLPPIGGTGAAEVTEAVLWALFPPKDHEVDPALDLHPTFEVPFFRVATESHSAQAQFLFPQAPLEAAGGSSSRQTTRWIDFLLSCPGGATAALKIDGDHRSRLAEDAQRDSALADNGIVVCRADGPSSLAPGGDLLSAVASCQPEPCDADEARTWRETLRAARFVYGIIEAVAAGLLTPGAAAWHVAAPYGVGDRDFLGSVLEAIAALDVLWTTGVMPTEIRLDGDTTPLWSRPSSLSESSRESTASISVDFAPTWASLPRPNGTNTEVVIRGVPLPSHARWDSPLSLERRALAADSGERDAGRQSKRRPAIIVEIDTDSAAVLAIHGTGSAVAHGGGRRLASWRTLKLRKPSVVSPRTVWVPLRTLGPFISELDHDDRQRFGIGR